MKSNYYDPLEMLQVCIQYMTTVNQLHTMRAFSLTNIARISMKYGMRGVQDYTTRSYFQFNKLLFLHDAEASKYYGSNGSVQLINNYWLLSFLDFLFYKFLFRCHTERNWTGWIRCVSLFLIGIGWNKDPMLKRNWVLCGNRNGKYLSLKWTLNEKRLPSSE